MKHVLKSELMKLLTIRSTYILLAIPVVLVGGITFWAEFKVGKGVTLSSEILRNTVLSVLGTMSLFLIITSVLNMAHEYRYNTIMYTLSNTKARWQVLAAKALVISGYAVVFSLVVSLVTVVAILIATNARGDSVALQGFNPFDVIWRGLFYSVGTVLFALVITVITRSIVAALALILVGINAIEVLVALVLPNNYQYFPLNALSSVITSAGGQYLEPSKGAVVTLIWLVFAWAIAAYLFITRDAN